jgi:hypothetical protein
MLEYMKKILEKVSFDPFLFNKELLKANRFLNHEEYVELYRWSKAKFGNLISPNKDCFAHLENLPFN